MGSELEELQRQLNRELERMGYHLRVNKLYPVGDMIAHDFVPPIDDEWANELPEVTALVATRLREWMLTHGYS